MVGADFRRSDRCPLKTLLYPRQRFGTPHFFPGNHRLGVKITDRKVGACRAGVAMPQLPGSKQWSPLALPVRTPLVMKGSSKSWCDSGFPTAKEDKLQRGIFFLSSPSWPSSGLPS